MIIFTALFIAALAVPASAQEGVSLATSSYRPTYMTLSPALSDFNRFADGGPDENWYIGFNNAWIVRLPPAPAGEFTRAFIGARLGRAKTRPHADKPWLRERIDGKVYMAIAQNPAFAPNQSFFLTDTNDIPMEASPQAHVQGVGGAEWYWTEVPLPLVSFTRPNYLIIWSPTKAFTKAEFSPILAAAAAETPSAEPRAWNNNTISGVPPRSNAGALKTPLNNIHPALGLKLAPPTEAEISITELAVRRAGRRVLVEFSAGGDDIAESWLEISRDQLDWSRVGPILRRQPLQFALAAEQAPPGWYLRGVARDTLGNVGGGDAVMVPYAPR